MRRIKATSDQKNAMLARALKTKKGRKKLANALKRAYIKSGECPPIAECMLNLVHYMQSKS